MEVVVEFDHLDNTLGTKSSSDHFFISYKAKDWSKTTLDDVFIEWLIRHTACQSDAVFGSCHHVHYFLKGLSSIGVRLIAYNCLKLFEILSVEVFNRLPSADRTDF